MNNLIAIHLGDARYPALLRQTADPPRELFVRGDVSLLARPDLVAVVCTRYGTQATSLLVGALAASGAPIVSGLALGIDAAAHEAALLAGGRTIAVLPAGVCDADIGPRANYGLAQRILKSGGALVSEMPVGTPAYQSMFLLRNRIVAGMCRATLVIEAAEKSGALVTARLALEANRDVYAVPGPITSEASAGTNRLIAQGAIPALSPEFLLDQLGYATADASAAGRNLAYTDTEKAVLRARRAGAQSPDEIAENTGLPISIVLSTMAILDIKGAV
jgi:DNA processing protein